MSILDTIDGALADYEASGDAMRWVPEVTRTEENRPTDDEAALEAASAAAQVFERSMAEAAESIRRTFDVMKPIVEAQVKAFNQMGHSLHRSFYPKQHQRCTVCHPWRKPKPLAVNGHEYQRRLRARRRRR